MEKKDFFGKPKNMKILFIIFCSSLFGFLIAEYFIHKHTFFKWEEWHGFYAAFGFVAFVVLILMAKYILRPLVRKKEDYYD